MSISAKRVILTSFVVDIVDILLNLTIAMLTGSVVMVTEMIQGVADLITDILLLIGWRRSSLPADKHKPFGYGKEVYFWVMMSTFTMFTFSAGLSFYLGLKRFQNPEQISLIGLAYLTLLVSLVMNFYSLTLGFRRIMGSRKLSSVFSTVLQTPFVLTRTTFITDVVGTTAALVGLVALLLYGITGQSFFDGLGAMMVGVLMAILSVMLLFTLKDFIAGKSAEPRLIQKIHQIVLQVPEVKEVLDLKTMYFGPEQLLVNLELHFADNLTTDQLEQLIDQIKQKLTTTMPYINHVQIELETPTQSRQTSRKLKR